MTKPSDAQAMEEAAKEYRTPYPRKWEERWYETMMLYEVGYEVEEAFEAGAIWQAARAKQSVEVEELEYAVHINECKTIKCPSCLSNIKRVCDALARYKESGK